MMVVQRQERGKRMSENQFEEELLSAFIKERLRAKPYESEVGIRAADEYMSWKKQLIAEVERVAAEKALTGAADVFEGAEINLDVFNDPVERVRWSYSNETRRNLVLTLRDRAEAYRREGKE